MKPTEAGSGTKTRGGGTDRGKHGRAHLNELVRSCGRRWKTLDPLLKAEAERVEEITQALWGTRLTASRRWAAFRTIAGQH